MLTKPIHGWTDITIGDWTDRCSYLTNVPFDIFHAIDSVIRTSMPSVVYLDAEGMENLVVFDCSVVHIINCNRDCHYSYFTFDFSIEDAAREFINDIRENIDDWAAWDADPEVMDNYDDYVNERKKDLDVCCNILERRL